MPESSPGQIEVLLDGHPVEVPPERQSPAAIRTLLETLALQHHRILCAFNIDGKPAAALDSNGTAAGTFHRIDAESVDVEDLPLQLLRTALQQTAETRAQVQSAVVLVLINEGNVAREFWWELARKLKEPLLTLSLVPENIVLPANGCVSFLQLRKWQLEQLAVILGEIDQACWCDDTRVLSNALENRVVPWLDHLDDLLNLSHETLRAASEGRGENPT